MEQPLKRQVAADRELAGAWSFLPYEQELVTPRREVQVMRAVRALVIPGVDIVTLSIAVISAYFIAEYLINSGSLAGILGAYLGTMTYRVLWAGLGTIPLWLLIFILGGVYKREMRRLSVSTYDELPQTLGAIAIGAWVMYSFLVITSRSHSFSGRAVWIFVAIAWIMLMVMIPLGRAFVRVGFSFLNPFRESTLVVGAGEVGRSLIGRLGRHKEYGLRVVGFLDTASVEEDSGSSSRSPVQLLGRPSQLRAVVDRYGISRVIVAFSRTPHPLILEVIHQCQEMKVDVSIVPRFFEALSPRLELEDIEGLPLLSLPRYSRHGLLMRMAKRVIDLAGAMLAIILLSPMLLLVMLAIKLDSRGPVFYRQLRMGKNRKQFQMYKFRSMKVGSDTQQKKLVNLNEASGPIFKMKDDPRITRVGRFIRRWSIDELPQVINVIKGEMSLVGPRPLPVEEAVAYKGTADMRHQVQPGITGLWQILGRSDIPYEQMTQLDYLYVTNWTLTWDIKIIFRTITAIIRKRGAY